MSDMYNFSSNEELVRSVDDDGFYHTGDNYYEDVLAEPGEIFRTHDGDCDYGDQSVRDDENDFKSVDPKDAVLIIAENFHTLKSGVPDAANNHLWGLAQDCLRKEDSAADYVSYLISTSDYPVEQEEILREPDNLLNAALKYSSLRAILPEADSEYLWGVATEHADSNEDVFNQFVLHLQESGDFPRSNITALTPEQRTVLKRLEMSRNASGILHTIDSQYIHEKLNTDPAMGYNEEGVGQFVLNLMENTKLHPSKTEEYYRKNTREAINQYSNSFNVEKFLQKFPRPLNYFENPASIGGPKYRADVYKYLRSVVMPHVTNDRLVRIQKQNVSLLKCHRSFYGNSVPLQTIEYHLTDECGRFINELTYIRFQETILLSAEMRASTDDRHEEADAEGFYEYHDAIQCELCEEPVPFHKVMTCTEAHVFCAVCVRGWVNERLGQGFVVVNCLQTCTGTMPDEVLSRILPARALDKVIKRRDQQDISAATKEGIRNCLWCDYGYIPCNEDIDLICLNPDCGERWCTKCHQLAHHPKPCEDTPEEVKKRVYIEERMTTALVKQCPQCRVDILKVEGCDFVTCHCGTSSCYNCGQIAPTHHNCSQIKIFRSVRDEGQRAKTDAERLFPNVALNHDPTQ